MMHCCEQKELVGHLRAKAYNRPTFPEPLSSFRRLRMKFSISILKTFVALVALVAFATFAQGQNRERFGISAKAGGVNAVTGKVSVKSTGQPSRLLSSQDDLASGDIVATSLGSHVEVLLNPGTYLRLAEKSEFTMVDNSLDN